MQYTKLTIHTTPGGVEMVSNALIALGIDGFEVQDSKDFEEFLEGTAPHWDFVDEKLLALRDAESTVTLYAEDETAAEAVRAAMQALREQHEDYGSLAVEAQTVDDSAWTDTWKQYYKPIEIGRLAVVPVWEDYTPRAGQTVLYLDPGAAFGTGSHETTAMCLSFLSDMDVKGRVLDVGCGSGILAVAALLLGAQSAVGTDIDPLAVTAGRQNAELNGVAARATFLEGDFTKLTEGPFDIVTANIVADVILDILPDLVRFLGADGRLILSGIIDQRAAQVTQAIGRANLEIVKESKRKDWHAFLCRRAEK